MLVRLGSCKIFSTLTVLEILMILELCLHDALSGGWESLWIWWVNLISEFDLCQARGWESRVLRLAFCKGRSLSFLVRYSSCFGICEGVLLNVGVFLLILHNSRSWMHLQNLSLIPIPNSRRNPHPFGHCDFVQSDFTFRWIWSNPPKPHERSGVERWVTL